MRLDRYGGGRGGRPWRRIRERIMQRDKWLCQPCIRKGRLTEATQVDHKSNARNKDGKLDDSDRNLQAICDDCHDAKTQEEALRARGIKPKQEFGADGWPV